MYSEEKTLKMDVIKSLINAFASMEPEDQRVCMASMEGMANQAIHFSTSPDVKMPS